jgi:hypothetical protein
MNKAPTGPYLVSDKFWWCSNESGSGPSQTREHLFKHCYRWKDQQITMWREVKNGNFLRGDRRGQAVSAGIHTQTAAHRRGWDSKLLNYFENLQKTSATRSLALMLSSSKKPV